MAATQTILSRRTPAPGSLLDLSERLDSVTDRRNAAKRESEDAAGRDDFETAYDALVRFNALQQRGSELASEIRSHPHYER